jgi:hypothetical protein
MKLLRICFSRIRAAAPRPWQVLKALLPERDYLAPESPLRSRKTTNHQEEHSSFEEFFLQILRPNFRARA